MQTYSSDRRLQSRLLLGLSLFLGTTLAATPVQASSEGSMSFRGRDCPGFRVIRDRSDNEAPRLPRQSIAARAILSPDGCDRSRELAQETPDQPNQPAESQQTSPDLSVPLTPRPTDRPIR